MHQRYQHTQSFCHSLYLPHIQREAAAYQLEYIMAHNNSLSSPSEFETADCDGPFLNSALKGYWESTVADPHNGGNNVIENTAMGVETPMPKMAWISLMYRRVRSDCPFQGSSRRKGADGLTREQRQRRPPPSKPAIRRSSDPGDGIETSQSSFPSSILSQCFSDAPSRSRSKLDLRVTVSTANEPTLQLIPACLPCLSS